MVRICYLLSMIPLLAAFMIGCGSNPQAITAPLGEAFTLAVGQTAQISGENLALNFVEVVGDSRCPKNAVCIWQGEASSHLKITYQDVSYSVVLNQPGNTNQSQDTFIDYKLVYNLLPYPVAGQDIHPGDYRLTLTVNK